LAGLQREEKDSSKPEEIVTIMAEHADEKDASVAMYESA
jgi:hypothetical protein